MSPPPKSPRSELGGVQPYLEEGSERGASDSRGWRRLEKIFWLWKGNDGSDRTGYATEKMLTSKTFVISSLKKKKVQLLIDIR